MKKRLITLLIPLLLSLVFISQPAQAHTVHTRIPNVLATASLDWKGTTYGGMSVFHVDDPALVGTGSYWHRRIILSDNAEPGDLSLAEVGIQKVKANVSDPICGLTSPHDQLYYYWRDVSRSGASGQQCYDVPNNEKNTYVRFRAYTTLQGDGSILSITIFNGIPGGTNTLDQTAFDQELEFSDFTIADTYNGDVSGHRIYGSTFTQNNWRQGAGNWTFQTVPSGNHLSGCLGSGCPGVGGIQMYWEDGKYPANSGSAGGTLDDCLYATYGGYSECSIGG